MKFYREDYKEADHYFSQLVEQHPNSPLAPQAIELAIIAKHMSTGGADYDGRKVAEARILIDTAMRNYPELAVEKNVSSEAARQHHIAAGGKRLQDGRVLPANRSSGAAYYYYEIVRRTYPNTRFKDQADEKLQLIRRDMEAGKYSEAERDKIAELLNKWEGLFTKGGSTSTGAPPPPPTRGGAPGDPRGMQP